MERAIDARGRPTNNRPATNSFLPSLPLAFWRLADRPFSLSLGFDSDDFPFAARRSPLVIAIIVARSLAGPQLAMNGNDNDWQ